MKYGNVTKYNITDLCLSDNIPGLIVIESRSATHPPVKVPHRLENTAIGSFQAMDEVVSSSRAIEIVFPFFGHQTTTLRCTTHQ